MIEKITAYGHGCVTSKHPSTLEFTKGNDMGWEAHCIVGRKANKSCSDLSPELKKALKEGRRLSITVKAGDVSDRLVAFGHPLLTLTNTDSIVIRRSGFVDDRTMAVHASKSSNHLNRELVKKLQNPRQKVEMIIEF